MSKLVRLFALMMAMTVVAVPATLTSAQDKKEVKKDDKKKDEKKEVKKDTKKDSKKSTGTIEIGEAKNGKFYFTIRDADNKYICGSTPIYASKDDIKKAIESLKEVLESPKVVDVKKDEKKEKEKEKDKQ
jgi:uncharacterized protein YegP (UPF0339 family)